MRWFVYLLLPALTLSVARPVIFLHGLFNNDDEPDFATKYLSQKVPGTVVYYINLYNGLSSLLKLDHQLTHFLPAIQQIMDDHRDTGVNLLCYSQGGVICRSAVQMLDNHTIHSMITLSSPLNGQYGVTNYIKPFLPDKDRKYLYTFLYTSEGQEISVGDYWNDPHHQQEFSDPGLNVLLARLNNQTGHPESEAYKRNFQRLQQLVMIGGPDDEVITPWQSAQFGMYNDNETVLPLEKQPWYKGDDFGMRTLNERGAVHRFTIPGLGHHQWYQNSTVFDCCVIPYL